MKQWQKDRLENSLIKSISAEIYLVGREDLPTLMLLLIFPYMLPKADLPTAYMGLRASAPAVEQATRILDLVMQLGEVLLAPGE